MGEEWPGSTATAIRSGTEKTTATIGPQLLKDGTALVPGTRIGDESITFERPDGEMTLSVATPATPISIR